MMPMREPYVGEGADGARRSAQIDPEECDTLPPGELQDLRLLSAERWQTRRPRSPSGPLPTPPATRARNALSTCRSIPSQTRAPVSVPLGDWGGVGSVLSVVGLVNRDLGGAVREAAAIPSPYFAHGRMSELMQPLVDRLTLLEDRRPELFA